MSQARGSRWSCFSHSNPCFSFLLRWLVRTTIDGCTASREAKWTGTALKLVFDVLAAAHGCFGLPGHSWRLSFVIVRCSVNSWSNSTLCWEAGFFRMTWLARQSHSS